MNEFQSSLTNIAALQRPDGFAQEQARLGQVWTCVGTTKALKDNQSWFRTTLGGRSIFLQKTRSGLRGFENRCAHRSYPLRTADNGIGPMVCGFHHWRYDDDGLALGIPKCLEMYGARPKQLDAQLTRLDVEECGGLIFARFAPPGGAPSLKTYLGATYPVVQAMSAQDQHQRRFVNDVRANWRLIAHISLDDYHIVAVHPKSFGKSGYLDPENVSYLQDGWHSAFFSRGGDETMQSVASACESGTLKPEWYKTWFVFPNLVLSHVHVLSIGGLSVWYMLALYYEPIAHDRTRLHVVYQPSPFSTRGQGVMGIGHDFFERIRSYFVGRSARTVIAEDNEVCEGLQTNMGTSDGTVYLASQEKRMRYFEDAYASALRMKAENEPRDLARA